MLVHSKSGVPEISPEATTIIQRYLVEAMDDVKGTDMKSEAIRTSLQVFSMILGQQPRPSPPPQPTEVYNEPLPTSLPTSKKSVPRRRKSKKKNESLTPCSAESTGARKPEDGPGCLEVKKRIRDYFGQQPWVKELEKALGDKIFVDRLRPVRIVPERTPDCFNGQMSAPKINTLHKPSENCLLCNKVRHRYTDQIGVLQLLELSVCHLYLTTVSINVMMRFRDFMKKLEAER
jgi:hypothetical protein